MATPFEAPQSPSFYGLAIGDGYPRGARRQSHTFSLTIRTLSVSQMTRPLEKRGLEIAAGVWMILPPSVLGSGRVNGADPAHTAIARHRSDAF